MNALVSADEALERGEVPTVPHEGSPVYVATRRGSRLVVKREHEHGLWEQVYFGAGGLKGLAGWRPHEVDGLWDDNAPRDWLSRTENTPERVDSSPRDETP